MVNIKDFQKEARIIGDVLKKAPSFDRELRVTSEEYKTRQQKVYKAIIDKGLQCGILYSNEQYDGDVSYLGGNTNITVKSVEGMLSILRSGMYETQVAKWGYAIAFGPGVEELGIDVIVIKAILQEHYKFINIGLNFQLNIQVSD